MSAPAQTSRSGWIETGRGFIGATWFRPPAGRVLDTAVLIVPGVAHEERTMSGGVAALAESLAAAGLSSLLIDLTGTSQSAGQIDMPDIGEHWRADIRAALQATRDAGFARTLVVGVRLGALLALDALRGDSLPAMVAWSPIASGQRHLRELKMLQGTGLGQVSVESDSIAVAGFDLPPSVLTHVTTLDLTRVEPLAPRRLLLLDSEVRLDAKWVARFREQGVEVEPHESADVERWLFSASDQPALPTLDIEFITAWSVRQHDALGGRADAGGERAPPTQVITFEHRGQRIRETIVQIEPVGLAAVFSEPLDRPAEGVARLMMSTVGPGRTFTDFARDQASLGRVGLRFDFAGFGTSNRRDNQPAESYTDEGRKDVADAVAYLRERGQQRVALVGFCAGAWSMIQAGPLSGVVAAAAINVALYRQPDPPKHRVGGDSQLAKLAARFGGTRLLKRVSKRMERTSSAKHQPVEWLETLCAAQVKVLLTYADEDPGLHYINRQLQGGLRGYLDSGGLSLAIYKGLGHLAEGARPRRAMFEDIASFLARID